MGNTNSCSHAPRISYTTPYTPEKEPERPHCFHFQVHDEKQILGAIQDCKIYSMNLTPICNDVLPMVGLRDVEFTAYQKRALNNTLHMTKTITCIKQLISYVMVLTKCAFVILEQKSSEKVIRNANAKIQKKE